MKERGMEGVRDGERNKGTKEEAMREKERDGRGENKGLTILIIEGSR
jgi:hypothetical protein